MVISGVYMQIVANKAGTDPYKCKHCSIPLQNTQKEKTYRISSRELIL